MLHFTSCFIHTSLVASLSLKFRPTANALVEVVIDDVVVVVEVVVETGVFVVVEAGPLGVQPACWLS